MKMTNGGYHYTESGLDDVYLADGYEFLDAPSGRQVVISDIDGLHDAIGACLVNGKKNLSGKELRFLRHEMLMSQAALANLLNVSEQAVRRWENGKSEVSGPAEAIVRLLYIECKRGDERLPVSENIRGTLKKIAGLEDALHRLTFRDSKEGWKLAERLAA